MRLVARIVAMGCFVWFTVATALPSFGRTEPPVAESKEEPIVLPRFTVLSEFLTITFSRSMGGSLTGGEVTRVAKDSPADRRGIQVNDELISINGVDIVGQNYTDTRDLIERELKPGESIRLRFSGRRGFFQRVNYVFVITRPNQVPEPTAHRVAPSADALVVPRPPVAHR